MHGSAYIALVQIGLIVGVVNLLARIPTFRLIGIPAVSMGLSLFIGSVIPRFFPGVNHTLFPDTPVWPQLIQFFVVTTLGAFAGREIEFRTLKSMGPQGLQFIGASLIAPVIFALPIGVALAIFPNPFIQPHANAVGVVIGVVAILFMRALPTMVAFFRGNHWQNDLVKVSLAGASMDDLTVFVVIQPIIAGLAHGGGFSGIIQSATAVIVTALGMTLVAALVRTLPRNFREPVALAALFVGAGLGEMHGHVHIILTGILWGLLMPHDVSHSVEEHLKGWTLIVGVPLFFAGLGITRQFDVLNWAPWILLIPCFAAVYMGHSLITSRVASQLFGGSKAAGKVLAALCRTHGTADVLLAVSLMDLGILTGVGLSGMVLFLMVSTIHAFNQAQSMVNRHPELASAKIDVASATPRPTFRPGMAVMASQDAEQLEEHD